MKLQQAQVLQVNKGNALVSSLGPVLQRQATAAPGSRQQQAAVTMIAAAAAAATVPAVTAREPAVPVPLA